MTGLGFTGNLVAILVLLLVIGMTWLLLRHRIGQSASAHRRRRADKGKVQCQTVVDYDDRWRREIHCKNKAGWVTPQGYFCDDHWEPRSLLRLKNGSISRVRWAHQLNWRKKGTDVWTT